jgi:hypothetical protein
MPIHPARPHVLPPHPVPHGWRILRGGGQLQGGRTGQPRIPRSLHHDRYSNIVEPPHTSVSLFWTYLRSGESYLSSGESYLSSGEPYLSSVSSGESYLLLR